MKYKNPMVLRKGHELRKARISKGLTQKQVCQLIDGVSQSNLSEFENGHPALGKKKVNRIMEILTVGI